MADLSTRLFDVILPSPFILASGPLSYSAEALWAAYRAGAGGATTKTLRLEPAVNPTPHMVLPRSNQLRGTLFNSEKWTDLSWPRWIAEELPALAGHPGALIASIGHTPAEAHALAGPVSGSGVVDIIECVAYDSPGLVETVRAAREHTDLPILAKLSFNWGDALLPAAEACLKAGASGFTAIDSIGPALQVDVETARATVGGVGGRAWMSGAAIRPVAQAIVADLVTRFGVPVVGTGGITQVEDAVEMTMVGATAVGVCTVALLRGLEWLTASNDKLAQWLDAHAYPDLAAIRGLALAHLQQEEDTRALEFAFDPALCTLCALCWKLCPYDARTLTGDKPRSPDLAQHVDAARCRSCGLCVEVCRPGALAYANWPR